MRLLIDGYNLMHALGLMPRSFGPDGFRRARLRFLNQLVAHLDPWKAGETVIVFDAAHPPPGRPEQIRHKGLTVLYAVNDEDADTRLEYLIAAHSAPKGLTVVSSDHRIRQAAARRKAIALTADAFWEGLTRVRPRPVAPPDRSPDPVDRQRVPTASESAYWERAFGAIDDEPGTLEALNGSQPDFAPSDEDLRRIAREVEGERF